MAKKDFKFEIKDTIGILKEYNKGWTKSVIKIQYQNNEDTIDIRMIDNDNNFIGKGISLSEQEADKLCDMLCTYGYGTLDVLDKEVNKRKKRFNLTIEDCKDSYNKEEDILGEDD